MLGRLTIVTFIAVGLAVATLSYAQRPEYGSAAEAKAMLEKTVTAI